MECDIMIDIHKKKVFCIEEKMAIYKWTHLTAIYIKLLVKFNCTDPITRWPYMPRERYMHVIVYVACLSTIEFKIQYAVGYPWSFMANHGVRTVHSSTLYYVCFTDIDMCIAHRKSYKNQQRRAWIEIEVISVKNLHVNHTCQVSLT